MFSLVDVLPFGWRALYFLGVAPERLARRYERGR